MSRLHKEDAERVEHPTQKPLEIIQRMLLASCPENGVVLDPFMGSGTTAIAARRCGRQFVGFELNPEYCAIIEARLLSAEAELQVLNNQPTEPVRAKPVQAKASKRISKTKTKTKTVATKAKANVVKPAVRKKSAVALET